MAIADLTSGSVAYADGYDSVVIVDNFKSKRGGATLDTTGYPLPYIRAGHVIIQETATGELKPMPIAQNGGAYEYDSLPGGHTYYGILINTIKTDKPFAGIMFEGTVNPVVGTLADAQAQGYFDITGILSAVQTAFRGIDNNIKFIGDNQ